MSESRSVTHWRVAPVRSLVIRLLICALLLAGFLGQGATSPAAVLAQTTNPAPVQVFYVTLPEGDAVTTIDTISGTTGDAVSPAYTYFSIAIGVDGTYVYYDHWGDGYAGDIANPTVAEIYSPANLSGVQIWGNGQAVDGCAPNINGVPFTCSDANDVLSAGDVIIPYNAVPVPRVVAPQRYVLDQFAAVSYSNNNGNTTWSSDWVDWDTTYPTFNYRDQFGTAAYNNSNGSLDWSGQTWTEVADDGSPSGGDIRVETGVLRFRTGADANDAIWRTASGLSGYTSATLSFTLNGSGIDGFADRIAVQASGDGGATWTTLQTYSTDPNGATSSFDVTAYKANLAVQFILLGNDLGDLGESWDIDNVDITVVAPPIQSVTGPSAGPIQVVNGALRFTAAGVGDRIDRGVDLSVGGACAALSFTLGQSNIDAAEDRLAVQVSPNGTSWTTLETFDAPTDAGAKGPYDISGYANANTRIRFLAVDALEANEYWSIDDVRIDWDCYLPVLFDAKDKVAASNSIAMARAVWATGPSTLNAFAHELYPTSDWGLMYESPVGVNTTAGAAAPYQFEYSALSIMASQNETLVDVDTNGDGTFELNDIPLDEGGHYLATGISQGARVVADKPVQVVLLTGDINDGYESRDMNLLPVEEWGPSYWSPVGVVWSADGYTNPTRIYLHNLSTNGTIYITCERYGVANVTLGPLAAGDTTYIDLVAGQGGHFYASDAQGNATDDVIFAVGTIDTAPLDDNSRPDGSRSDWSFTLFPDMFLTTEALVGLGLGKDPTNTTSTENGSPLWVTAACQTGSTYVYVDWNNDGVADPVDTNGDDVAEVGSENGIVVNRLQSVRLFEPGADEEEYDQSGARVWSCSSANTPVREQCTSPGCKLALAWGQDPNNATAGEPGLDVGTSVPPLREVEGTKTLTIVTDTEPTGGVLNPGDIVLYNITIENTGSAMVTGVYVYDTAPANTTYVADTTEWSADNVNWTPIGQPDGGVLPISASGGYLLGDLDSGDSFYVRFRIELNDGIYSSITNCDSVYTDAGDFGHCVTTPVATRDWGDLPDTYGTSAAANGPRHSYDGLTLGALWDIEAQGVPTTAANGDDLAQSDDEDGVINTASGQQWYDGQGSINVTVVGGTGCLNAWFDFTGDAGLTLVPDGNFRDLGTPDPDDYDTYTVGGTYSEHVIQNMVLTPGTHSIALAGLVPAGLNGGATTSFFARFRLSPLVEDQCTTVTPTGYVTGGEIEDHQFPLGWPTNADLGSFTARGLDNAVQLRWVTMSEVDTAGFNLYRARWPKGPKTQVNAELIPSLVAPGSGEGAVYRYRETGLRDKIKYYYWLEVVGLDGTTKRYGPIGVLTQ